MYRWMRTLSIFDLHTSKARYDLKLLQDDSRIYSQYTR